MVVDVDAIVVVDLINVFVEGRLGSKKFKSVVRETRRVMESSGKFTVFVQDSHHPGDAEISVWGEHAMEGTEEAETVSELKGMAQVIRKRTYDAFYKTGLEELLRSKNAKNILFCGVVTDICIVHTVASAFFAGFSPIVAKECTSTYSEKEKNRVLGYMAKNYGAKIISVREIIGG